MLRALALAAATTALAGPNPQVGCVLTRNSEILGVGAHLYEARDHAEIAALKDARARNHDPCGATAYVTLEPCAHHGRTPPCADALIAAGIRRAVVATVDPNPLVRGQGLAKLRQAGIEVTLGTCEPEARALNNAFAFAIQHRRPFVTLKAALSADGYLAPPPAQRTPGRPFWLTGPAARAEVQQLRHASDALLTGIGTVLVDDPALTDRTGLPRRRPLLRVILDTHLRTPLRSKLAQSCSHDVLILCSTSAPQERRTLLEQHGIEVKALPAPQGRLDPAQVLSEIASRAMSSVLLEAGSQVNHSFLARKLVDRVVLFYAPVELGPDALRFADGIPEPHELQQQLLSVARDQIGPDQRVSGLLHDPWSGVPSTQSAPAGALTPHDDLP